MKRNFSHIETAKTLTANSRSMACLTGIAKELAMF
jgi:hypothetical protein